MERLATRECRSKAYWDQALSSWATPYLAGTLSIDTRNVIVGTMIRHALRDIDGGSGRSLLDIGCAAGTLVDVLDESFVRYDGVDISEVAIQQAKGISRSEMRRRTHFVISDLTIFQPDTAFDAIVFNEVLYYLSLKDAIAQVDRYSRHLSPGGVIAVSTKDDGKSHAIMVELTARFDPVFSTLWQPHLAPSFKLEANRDRPAFVVAVFRPRKTDGTRELPQSP
jgi:predicted TPR repeat methyltransferase